MFSIYQHGTKEIALCIKQLPSVETSVVIGSYKRTSYSHQATKPEME
jgi:hypothetical protein